MQLPGIEWDLNFKQSSAKNRALQQAKQQRVQLTSTLKIIVKKVFNISAL